MENRWKTVKSELVVQEEECNDDERENITNTMYIKHSPVNGEQDELQKKKLPHNLNDESVREEDNANQREQEMTHMICTDLPAKETNREESILNEKMTNIMYVEPMADDTLLYCEECKMEHTGNCPVHGIPTVIHDTKVEETSPDRALHSLPLHLLIKLSNIIGAGLGVFTDIEISPGTICGPYEGMKIKDAELANSSGYCWQIYKDGTISHYIDGKDTAASNWMRYVNCALSDYDQNLEAFQYKGEIYYRCIKPILPNTELLVWYGNDCARKLGINKNNTNLTQPVNGEAESSKKLVPFKCDVCKKLFDVRYKYTRHMKIHAQVKPYKCKFCDKRFPANSNLYKHLTVHTDARPFKCSSCEKAFKNHQTLLRHMRKHTGERPFKCEYCGKTFQDNSAIYRHLKIHTGEKLHKCEVCEKPFFDRSSLVEHSRVHTGERPYQCEHCGKAFKNRSALLPHKRSHTGEKPYQCEVCSKSFSDGSTFKTHKRLHTGERPYKCDICDKTFNQITSLNVHKRVHTGEKPYMCEVCCRTFNQNTSLKRHMKVHSKEAS